MSEVATDEQNFSEIISSVQNGIGFITLNRLKVLNSLSLNMIRIITQLLQEWAPDPKIRAVVVQGAGERAFCAGGDVRAAYEAKQEGREDLIEAFFREEYTLNTIIQEYPKPYIAILDGIAMGGGLGLSLNSPHSIVTERSILAMPETAIGFFPDVGATWFLSKTPDSIGLYWGMTGNRFNGADAIYARLSNYYVPSSQVCELLTSLQKTDNIIGTMDVFQAPSMGAPVQHIEEEIHLHFSRPSVEEIIKSLEGSSTDFAQKTLSTLQCKSPLSLYITFEQLTNVDPEATFRERIQREFRLSQRFMKSRDFFEGIRALLVDKDLNPQWEPAEIASVNPHTVSKYFESLGPNELKL